MDKNKNQKVDISIGKVDLPKVDYTKYVGKKAKIGSIEVLHGEFGYFLQIKTTPVDVVQFGKEQKEIRASRNFTLGVDKDGKVGWGDTGKLVDFMKLKNVDHPDKLLGREVIIQMDIKDNGSFLSFI